MTRDEALALTDENIATMTPTRLAEAYNLLVGPDKAVKRFADAKAGQRRLRMILSAERNGVNHFAFTKDDVETGFTIQEEEAKKEETEEPTKNVHGKPISGLGPVMLDSPGIRKALKLPVMEPEVVARLPKIAKREVARMQKTKEREAVAKKAAAKAKAKAPKVAPEGEFLATVAATCRKMVSDGLSNEEIWAKVSKHFNMPESKRHYPAWYRADMDRKAGIKKGPKENVM